MDNRQLPQQVKLSKLRYPRWPVYLTYMRLLCPKDALCLSCLPFYSWREYTQPPRFVKRIVLRLCYDVQGGFEPTCNASPFSIAFSLPKTLTRGGVRFLAGEPLSRAFSCPCETLVWESVFGDSHLLTISKGHSLWASVEPFVPSCVRAWGSLLSSTRPCPLAPFLRDTTIRPPRA